MPPNRGGHHASIKNGMARRARRPCSWDCRLQCIICVYHVRKNGRGCTDRAHEVEVNPKILGVERVLSAPRSQSFLYRGQLRDAYLTIEVYRVGHVYTARVQVTKNGRWWAFLRPATAGEAGVWRSIFASRQIIITPVFKK